jgi:hypothetical protein
VRGERRTSNWAEMAWPQGQGWGGGVVLQQAVKPPSSCALGVGEQQADGKRRSLLLLLGGYRNLIEAHKYCCKGYHSAEVYNTHHIQRLKYNSNCAIDSISSNSSSSSFITSQVSRLSSIDLCCEIFKQEIIVSCGSQL